MPPPIQILAERLAEARGLEYRLQYKALKEHLKRMPDVDFLAEMSRVDNRDIFRHLWAVGLTRRQQQMATMRWKELTE